MKDTIVAIATAFQEGAISIIRLSGDQALLIADSLFSKDLMHAKSHTITYGYIKDPLTQELVDEVLVSVFLAPKTFTRENVVEIHCHGGTFITKKVLRLCLANGARLAEKGEFTRRAFLNGRIDLTQAEAIHDMIMAQNDVHTKMAMQGIKGSVRRLLEPLIQDVLDIIANIEVNIDYPEYDDVVQLTNTMVLPTAKQWVEKIDAILQQAESGKVLKEGIKTAIVGKPNVGKSSLLNALLEEEKAIVSDVEGTTRDLVEGSIVLHGITLHLIDTAGIRDTEDKVEKIGIQRSRKAIEEAQLVIVVLDGSKHLDEQDEELLALAKEKTHLIVYNKADLVQKKSDGISVSAKHGEIDALMQALQELYASHKLVVDTPLLTNERQIALILRAKKAMQQAIEAMHQGFELDLVEIDIQDAYMSLKEILGEAHREDLLDTLFTNFCLGK